MKTLLAVGLLCSIVVLAAGEALAGHRHHGHHGYHHGHSDDALIAGGIIGGAILLGNLLAPRPVVHPRPVYSPPAYYAPPPPVYYAPPPPVYYAPPPRTCSQDRVYRYLPDGRIQWGTRTTCY